jgi:hypothetical protein
MKNRVFFTTRLPKKTLQNAVPGESVEERSRSHQRLRRNQLEQILLLLTSSCVTSSEADILAAQFVGISKLTP